MLQILKAKIQEITVTESHIDYPGSISIPDELRVAAGIKQFELVHVNNKTNGSRIITYVARNSRPGFVSVNGAASKHFQKGDLIHISAFALMNEEEAESFLPKLVIADKNNRLLESRIYSF